MGEIIKNPQQKRSLEKKERIVDAGLALMRERGYYNVNTAEIAKAAGVSTGILYRYFENKMDILMAIIDKLKKRQYIPYLNEIAASDFNMLQVGNFLEKLIDALCDMHEEMGMLHNDIYNLARFSPDGSNAFTIFEEQLTQELIEAITHSPIHPDHAVDKLHIAYTLVEGYCHEKVFQKHEYLDFDYLKSEIIRTIIFIMTA